LSLLQRRLAEDQDRAFSDYLAEVAGFWQQMSEDRGVELKVEAEPLAVGPDAASSLALIVHELVSNAIKYAFLNGKVGSVEISFRRAADGWAELAVSDNGVGLPASGPRSGSLGLELVERLSRQVGGRFDITNHCGTTARVRFPLG
jgi:two-component sensor histidine kinase